MSDCEFFGNCPEEVEEPTVVEEEPVMEEEAEVAEGDMMMEEEEAKPLYMMLNTPMMGNVAFLMAAIGGAVGSALNLFRYKSASTYYDGTKW